MNSNRAALTMLFLCLGVIAQAEETERPYVEPSEVLDPWLFSPNAAGLTRYVGSNRGIAELSVTKGKGGFVDFSDSPDALSVNAMVESFFRLNRRIVVYGAMSYTNFSGHDMAGSAFIRSLSTSPLSISTSPLSQSASQSSLYVPYAALSVQPSRHLPFDIVEDSLTNTGTKHQDTYRLCGGLGIDIHKGFSFGARLDYTAANYAKYKDLRHKNKLMDLDLTAGFYWPMPLTDRLALCFGTNYLYHRTTESLQFSTYGKNDKVYNSLISYANFMGHVEQFGSTGYTDKSREMPLVSDYNGIGVQLHLSPITYNLSPITYNFSLYQSFTYAHRRGYYGRKSPYTITYADHESDLYHYNARLSAVAACGLRFSLDLSLNAENLRNDAANYRELENEQGATYYEYYTPVKTANKLWTDGTVAFTADLGTLRPDTSASSLSLPRWSLQLGLNWHHREQTAYSYPFVHRQDISSKEPFVALCRNIAAAHSSYWTLALHFSFLKGSGEPYEDFTLQTPSDKQEQPAVMDAYLWREYLWLTAPQYHVGGSVAYSFIMPATHLRTFVRLGASHHKANKTSEYSLGCDHTTASLAVGCNF